MTTETHEVQVAPADPVPEAPVNPTHSIWLPINKEIAEGLQVNSEAHVTFDGKVVEVSNDSFGIEENKYTVRLEVSRVKITHENVFEQLSREDD